MIAVHGYMERHLAANPGFAGRDYGSAAIALSVHTDVAGHGGFDLSDHPALRGWLARVPALPGFVAMPNPPEENAALIAAST